MDFGLSNNLRRDEIENFIFSVQKRMTKKDRDRLLTNSLLLLLRDEGGRLFDAGYRAGVNSRMDKLYIPKKYQLAHDRLKIKESINTKKSEVEE